MMLGLPARLREFVSERTDFALSVRPLPQLD
jgi:hypothetical protein